MCNHVYKCTRVCIYVCTCSHTHAHVQTQGILICPGLHVPTEVSTDVYICIYVHSVKHA